MTQTFLDGFCKIHFSEVAEDYINYVLIVIIK